MSIKITLTDWGARHYSPAPSIRILRAWAASGQIVPAPERVGLRWMVDENAVRVPLPLSFPGDVGNISHRAMEILKKAA